MEAKSKSCVLANFVFIVLFGEHNERPLGVVILRITGKRIATSGYTLLAMTWCSVVQSADSGAQIAKIARHCEPVRRLVWQSVLPQCKALRWSQANHELYDKLKFDWVWRLLF